MRSPDSLAAVVLDVGRTSHPPQGQAGLNMSLELLLGLLELGPGFREVLLRPVTQRPGAGVHLGTGAAARSVWECGRKRSQAPKEERRTGTPPKEKEKMGPPKEDMDHPWRVGMDPQVGKASSPLAASL